MGEARRRGAPRCDHYNGRYRCGLPSNHRLLCIPWCDDHGIWARECACASWREPGRDVEWDPYARRKGEDT